MIVNMYNSECVCVYIYEKIKQNIFHTYVNGLDIASWILLRNYLFNIIKR